MTVIQSLEITNFQRISAVKIEPTNNVIMLFGKNANGKTSVLDAIETTFMKFNARVTKRPVRDGACRADIKITMSDGTKLHQKFIPSGPTLTGENPAGKKIAQKDVDQAISILGVDAAAFINAGEKKQLETLLALVDLPFVPAVLDAQRKAIFDQRTLTGQQGKAIGEVTVNGDLGTDEVSVSELLTEYRAAESMEQQHNADLDALARAAAQINDIADEIERLVKLRGEAEVRHDQASDRIDNHATLPDITAIQQRIDNAEQENAAIRANNTARAQWAQKETLRAEWDELTAKLKDIDQRKADGLANAEMPVDGLSFDEEGVLYQGVPFSRASGAEQIIVSAAMIIATNPEVRTMVIRNGNVMDEDSLAVLQAMCEDNNFQAFVEFVSDSEDHEFRLVDGELAT